MGQTSITSKGESGARDRTRAIVACADPEIRQRLLSVLSEFVRIPMKVVSDSDLIPVTCSEVKAVVFGAKRRWRSYGA